MTETLLTARDVATRCRLCQRQIFKLASAGRLPRPLKVGRSTRWRESDIAAWIERGCRMPDAAGVSR